MTNLDIINAAKTLASVCDGAISEDGQGYNGRDAKFVHSILNQEYEPTPRQTAAIYNILRTYKGQLSGFGIDYDTLELDDPLEEEIPKATIRRHQIDPSWKDFKIHFGKYKGESLYKIFIEDPHYLKWIAQNFDDGEIKSAAIAILSDRDIKKDDVIDSTITLDYKDGKVVITSPFEAKFLCQELSIREWDEDLKRWTCPSMIIDEIIETFHNSSFEMKTTDAFEDEQDRIDALRETSNAVDSDFVLDHFGNGRDLMPFQNAGVKFLEVAGGNAMISDQMGLGKTAQALAYLQLHPELRPVVIVCPASLKYNWRNECEMWLETDDTIEIINGGKPHKLEADITIINYDLISKWNQTIKGIRPQVIIFDESHYVKNQKAARSKTAKDIGISTPHRILLTGTPVLNRPNELWNQLQILDPIAYDDKNFFRWHLRYTNAIKGEYGWDFSGSSNIDELAENLKHIMIRRTKDQVLPELPDKRQSSIIVPITNRKDYRKAESEFFSWVAEQKGIEAARRASRVEQLTKLEYLKQVAATGKLRASIEWISDFFESGEKLVVFATHKATIHAIEREFGNLAVKIDGSVSVEARQAAVDSFQNDPKVKLFIGNIKAAGVGITLTAASDVLFIELPWTPADVEQAADRVHRIGQKNAVNVYFLLADHTIDENIAAMLESKKKVIDKIMNEKNSGSDFNLFDLIRI